MTKGKLYVISGPSGVGKSTVVATVMKRNPNIRFSVSMTTRPIRPGEIDGISYYFVDHQAFAKAVERGELLEHAEYVGNCYGTPERAVEDLLESGIDVMMDIEPVGALQVQKKRPDATLIFMVAPSFSEIERRLNGRGDTPADKIKARLEKARWEYQQAHQYDYIVVNEDVDRASTEVEAIMLAAKCQAKLRMDYVKEDN